MVSRRAIFCNIIPFSGLFYGAKIVKNTWISKRFRLIILLRAGEASFGRNGDRVRDSLLHWSAGGRDHCCSPWAYVVKKIMWTSLFMPLCIYPLHIFQNKCKHFFVFISIKFVFPLAYSYLWLRRKYSRSGKTICSILTYRSVYCSKFKINASISLSLFQ